MGGIDSESVHEKINWLPDRHPYPIKCVLYLAFTVCTEVSWEAIYKLLENMGYYKITLKKGTEGAMVLATDSWTNPDEESVGECDD